MSILKRDELWEYLEPYEYPTKQDNLTEFPSLKRNTKRRKKSSSLEEKKIVKDIHEGKTIKKSKNFYKVSRKREKKVYHLFSLGRSTQRKNRFSDSYTKKQGNSDVSRTSKCRRSDKKDTSNLYRRNYPKGLH